MTNKIFSLSPSMSARRLESAVVDLPRSVKSNEASQPIDKILSRLIGDYEVSPKEAVMIDCMQVYAREHNGDFDRDAMTVTFDGEAGELTIHGFLQTTEDGEDYIEYQALLRTAPTDDNLRIRFYCGEPHANFWSAASNIKIK